MLSQHVLSSLSSAAPRRAWHWRPVDRKHSFPFGRRSQIPGSLCPFGPFLRRARVSHCRPVDRKHPFPFGRRSQIPGSPEPSGLFLHPAHSSLRRSVVDRKHSFLGRLEIPGSLDFFGPFLHRAHLSRRVVLRPDSFVERPAFSSLLVMIAGPAAAPSRRQPAPANSLSVNW